MGTLYRKGFHFYHCSEGQTQGVVSGDGTLVGRAQRVAEARMAREAAGVSSGLCPSSGKATTAPSSGLPCNDISHPIRLPKSTALNPIASSPHGE